MVVDQRKAWVKERNRVNRALSVKKTKGCGIELKNSCAYSPQQNGLSERKNRHLLEVTRSLLCGMSVPKTFWSDAVLTAFYLINRMPTRVLNGKSPFSIGFPDSIVFSLVPCVFGCVSFVHHNDPRREKLDNKSIPCVFLGYSPGG